MAFWLRWFRPAERKYDTLDLFREIYGGKVSSSGIAVNWNTMLEVATVLACCRVLAEGVAQVPWRVYHDDGVKPRRVASEHSLYPVIYRQPNRWQTSFQFRETIMFHLAIYTNAYVFTGRVGSNREVRELVPLEPQFMTVERKATGRLSYKYAPAQGQSVEFDEADIWHIRGPSWNGYTGMPAFQLLREAIGLAIAAERAQTDLHKSGAKVSGAYSIDGPLSPERYNQLAAWLDKYAMGGDRAGKPLILDNGAKWLTQQMSNKDAQHIETRDHQIQEICGAMRVQPLMIGFSDKASTYASAEQMFIAHVVHTLSPWYERIEQSADVFLLSEEDRNAGYYVKFTPNALMRGAAKDRAEFYVKMVGSVNATPGIMTRNEIRALEELPAIDGGDELFDPTPAPAAPPSQTA